MFRRGSSGSQDGGGRFNRFTDRARKTLSYAQEEAQRMGVSYIGTEHLLLGLLRDTHGAAAQILVRSNVDLARVRAEVERRTSARREAAEGREPGLTAAAKQAIELAVDESRRSGPRDVHEMDVLAGVARAEGMGAEVLRALGFDIEGYRVVSLSAARSVSVQRVAGAREAPRCPVCGREIEGAWKHCVYCGSAVATCPSCGAARLNIDDEAFCHECGAPLRPPPDSPTMPPQDEDPPSLEPDGGG